MKSPELVVIGGGIAGSCAALRAAQYGLKTVWFLGDRKTAKASRSKYVQNIDNMIGVSGRLVSDLGAGVLQKDFPEAAEHLRESHIHVGSRELIDNMILRVKSEGGDQVLLLEEAVSSLRHEDGQFEIEGPTSNFTSPAVVLATGVMDQQPLWPGPRGGDPKPQWIYPYANKETILYCIRCEGHLTQGVQTAVIGHGESAAQVSMMLYERYGTNVTLLTHGQDPEWSEEANLLLEKYGISVLKEKIQGVFGDAREGKLGGFRLADDQVIEVRLALVSMGLYRAYNDLAQQLGAELEGDGVPAERAHVLVDGNGETDIHNFYCVGDLAKGRVEPIRKQVYTAQEYAVRAVDKIDTRRRWERRKKLLKT